MQLCYPISDVLVIVRRPSYTLYDDRGTRCTKIPTPLLWRSAYTRFYVVKREVKRGYRVMRLA